MKRFKSLLVNPYILKKIVMRSLKSLTKINHPEKKRNDIVELISYGFFSLLAFVGTFFLLFKRKASPPLKPSQKIDIEIRYETEKDADATFLAQNLVKIIRMVLMPLESQIKKEDAKLIFVYGGEFWEMRLKNSSERLKNSVRRRLEAQEW